MEIGQTLSNSNISLSACKTQTPAGSFVAADSKNTEKVLSEISADYSKAISSARSVQVSSLPEAINQVPELYHITTAQNWQKIQKEGLILDRNVMDPLKRLYFFDKKNFLNAWTQAAKNDLSEADKLFMLYALRDEDLVLLKVPTKSLKQKVLDFRSYNECSPSKTGVHSFAEVLDYIKKGHVVEYLYNDNIPAESISLAGVIKRPSIEKLASCDFRGISENLVKLLSRI